MVQPPGRLVSDWMSDAGDSCTHHGFYEYITFYVHPNTNLSSSQNQTGQTFTQRLLQKIGTFFQSCAVCKTNICSQNKCKSSRLGGNSNVVSDRACTQMCVCVCVCVCARLIFFFLQRWLMKYQSVLFASMKLHNIKDFLPLPQEPRNLEFFTRLSPVSAPLKRL